MQIEAGLDRSPAVFQQPARPINTAEEHRRNSISVSRIQCRTTSSVTKSRVLTITGSFSRQSRTAFKTSGGSSSTERGQSSAGGAEVMRESAPTR